MAEKMGQVDGDVTRAWLRANGERVLARDLRRARQFADDWFLQAISDQGGALTVSCARELLEAALARAFRDHRREVWARRRARRAKRLAAAPVAGGSS